MIILMEIPGAIITMETDHQCYCLKCKKKTGLTKEVYKPKDTKIIIEKGNCRECGTKNRSFRKFIAYSSDNYRKLPYFGLYPAKRYSKPRWHEYMAPSMDLSIDYLLKARIKYYPQRKVWKPKRKSSFGSWIGGANLGTQPRIRPGGPYIGNPQRYRPGQQQPYGYNEQNQAYGQYMRGIESMVRNQVRGAMPNLTHAIVNACPNCGRVPPRLQDPANPTVSCECESQ